MMKTINIVAGRGPKPPWGWRWKRVLCQNFRQYVRLIWLGSVLFGQFIFYPVGAQAVSCQSVFKIQEVISIKETSLKALAQNTFKLNSAEMLVFDVRPPAILRAENYFAGALRRGIFTREDVTHIESIVKDAVKELVSGATFLGISSSFLQDKFPERFSELKAEADRLTYEGYHTQAIFYYEILGLHREAMILKNVEYFNRMNPTASVLMKAPPKIDPPTPGPIFDRPKDYVLKNRNRKDFHLSGDSSIVASYEYKRSNEVPTEVSRVAQRLVTKSVERGESYFRHHEMAALVIKLRDGSFRAFIHTGREGFAVSANFMEKAMEAALRYKNEIVEVYDLHTHPKEELTALVYGRGFRGLEKPSESDFINAVDYKDLWATMLEREVTVNFYVVPTDSALVGSLVKYEARRK